MSQEYLRNSRISINTTSLFTLNPVTHQGGSFSTLRTKHPGISRVMYFMLLNRARIAQICTYWKQNNPSISEWHNSTGHDAAVQLHLKKMGHSFERNHLHQIIIIEQRRWPTTLLTIHLQCCPEFTPQTA